jgi:5-methylcytosine-specific restriction endonuclease McrA
MDNDNYRTVAKAVRERDGANCVYCNFPTKSLNHILPRSRGGETTIDNCVVACRNCSALASTKVFPSFADKKSWVKEQRLRQVDRYM